MCALLCCSSPPSSRCRLCGRAYAPALTPALVRAAQTHYKWIASDFLPYPSEWSKALPGNAGFVMMRVTVRQSGRVLGTLTFNLSAMR